jgi:E3 ubiquitin-protein ligase CCNP1IP1
MSIDQQSLCQKNEELFQALRDKTKKCLQTQELYDKLKRRAMMGQVQDAASDAVDYTIQASAAINRLVDDSQIHGQHRQQHLPISSVQSGSLRQPQARVISSMKPLSTSSAGVEGWSGFSSHESLPTPASHRQRLDIGGLEPSRDGRVVGASSQRKTPPRQPLTSLSPNGVASRTGFQGYGMSAGLKVSHPQAGIQDVNLFARPVIRSQGPL